MIECGTKLHLGALGTFPYEYWDTHMNILKGMPRHTKRHDDGQHPDTPACALELCTPLCCSSVSFHTTSADLVCHWLAMAQFLQLANIFS